MKLLIILSILLLYCDLAKQVADIVNCNNGIRPLEDPESTCVRVTCTSSHGYEVLRCGSYECKQGQQIDIKDMDHKKIYPECCGGPICED